MAMSKWLIKDDEEGTKEWNANSIIQNTFSNKCPFLISANEWPERKLNKTHKFSDTLKKHLV